MDGPSARTRTREPVIHGETRNRVAVKYLSEERREREKNSSAAGHSVSLASLTCVCVCVRYTIFVDIVGGDYYSPEQQW